MRARLAANWKMHLYEEGARSLLEALRQQIVGSRAPIIICPPAIYLRIAVELLEGSALVVGAQNGYPGEFGAVTGEVSMAQLAHLGCQYVIVGHSERRQLLGEKPALLRQKVTDAQRWGLSVIYCIGETLAERQAGQTEAILRQQLVEVLADAPIAWERFLVAYEPVWAIGTGISATAQEAEATHQFIRAQLAALGAPAEVVPILYGGSLKATNAAELFAQPNVDGGLVGGASLVASEFGAIYQALLQAKRLPS